MSPPTAALRRGIALLGALLLAGCAQQGDFGRPADSTWNSLVDSTGAIAARTRGEPASDYPLTDFEQTLRDRAWRYLMPANTRAAFHDVLANLTRARVLPPSWRPLDLGSYYDDLTSDAFRSPVSRYRRLSDDATADARLVPPFAAIAARVIEADAQRLASLPFARTLDEDAVREAAMRVAENRCLIAWVRLETGLRVERYRYALEHLVVAMPGAESGEVARAIGFLDQRRALLAALLPADAEARCGLAPPPAFSAGLRSTVVAKY